jgi:hypothetical protein
MCCGGVTPFLVESTWYLQVTKRSLSLYVKRRCIGTVANHRYHLAKE